MGYYKEKSLILSESGLCQGANKYVCGNCINDSVLNRFIQKNADCTRCDYCGTTSGNMKSTTIEKVALRMAKSINKEYFNPVEIPNWDYDEACLNINHYDENELLESIGFMPESQQLFDDISDFFSGNYWCPKDQESIDHDEVLRYSWIFFRQTVMHHKRFTYWCSYKKNAFEKHAGLFSPKEFLTSIKQIAIDLALIKEIPKGSTYWRSRSHQKSETLQLPIDITPPHENIANQPNRMSPAGIPMFYGAEDLDTTLLEIHSPKNDCLKIATSGKFVVVKKIQILDLCDINKKISFFEKNGNMLSKAMIFIKQFANWISKKPTLGKNNHNEYAPTQIITEFIRYNLKFNRKKIHGIRYSSSINGKPNVVLFFNQLDCLPDQNNCKQFLAFDPSSVTITESLNSYVTKLLTEHEELF